jgi:hypothetical protein
VKFENLALVDDAPTLTDVVVQNIPKRISVYQLDFFKKNNSEEFPQNVKTMSLKEVHIQKRRYELEEEEYVPLKKKKTATGEYKKATKLCIYPGCTIAACFGQPGKKKTHCSEHRVKGDTSYNPKRKCNNCNETFTYQQWYFHSKICGIEDNTCNDCGGSFVNLFKHKYTCKNRLN